jgi:integrase
MASAWIERRKTPKGKTRYIVKYTLGGRRTQRRYAGIFARRADAVTRCAWVTGELAARRVPDFASLTASAVAPTLAEAMKRWQESRVDVSENTQLQHRSAVNRALPVLGSRRIDTITPADIADLVAAGAAKGEARETIRKTVSAVAQTLDYAGITPNPARDRVIVRLPREEKEALNPPPAEHLEAIYRLLPSKHRVAYLFLDWSGLRVGAIDKLLVSDFDEPRRRIRVRAEITKNKMGLWVELHPALAEAVEARLPPREDRDPAARLFAPSASAALRTSMAKACAAAGIPLYSPHDLRHRRVSLLHLRGMPWARIGEMVGQSDLATTANTYTHVLLDERELNYEELLARAT